MSNNPATNRRQFLGRAGAAIAASAAPYYIPAGVLAADGQPGANDRIGIAGIGIGRQGTGVLANAVGSKDCRFIAVADVNRKRAEDIAKKHKGEPYQDYRRVLDRKDVDAIVTATPEHWRALICIQACQAGKDIYAEKPVSLTIREGRLMVEAARKYKRIFQVGSQQRSQPINRAGSEFIRKGGMGKIEKIIVMNYPSPFYCGLPGQPVPDEIDWDMWCGPTQPVPYHPELYIPRGKPGWLSFQPYSGGEMTGWGAHGFDQIQLALGTDASGPTEVWVEGEKYNPPTIREPESNKRPNQQCSEPKVFFRYASGVVLEPGKGPSFGGVFIGEKGKFTIERGKLTSDPPELAQEVSRGVSTKAAHVENWIACMKSRELPTADIEIGHRSATVCHLGNIARWTNRRLKWDPVKEIFPGDDEANSYLDRERRKPWVLPSTI